MEMPRRPIVGYRTRLTARAQQLAISRTSTALARLVIEVDGDSHFDGRAQQRDAARTEAIETLGLRVVRFRNDEIGDSFEGVCGKIVQALKT